VNVKLHNYIASIEPKTLSQLALAIVVLLTIIALSLEAYNSYALYSDSQSNPASSKQKTVPSSKNHSTHIVQAAFFGAVNNNKLSNINLPKTKLQLTLRGAFTSINPAKASAIIEGSDKKSRHYNVGSSISNGTELRAVYDDRVVLATNQNLETLYFPSNTSPSITSSTDTQIPATSNQNISEQQRKELVKQRLEELRRRIKR
jgi:general secretion pathway protein C